MKTWSSFCATFIVMTQSRVKPKSNQTFANQDIMLIPYQCGDGASTRGSGRAPAYLKERALEQELQVPEKAIRWHDTQLICSDVQAPLIEHEILKMTPVSFSGFHVGCSRSFRYAERTTPYSASCLL